MEYNEDRNKPFDEDRGCFPPKDAGHISLSESAGPTRTADQQVRWDNETHSRTVAIEDEWQTVQDHLEDDNAKEAGHFLDRLISEAKKLQIHLKAKPPISYNAEFSQPRDEA